MLEIIVLTYFSGSLVNLLLIALGYKRWENFVKTRLLSRPELQAIQQAFGDETLLKLAIVGQMLLSWYFLYLLMVDYIRRSLKLY